VKGTTYAQYVALLERQGSALALVHDVGAAQVRRSSKVLDAIREIANGVVTIHVGKLVPVRGAGAAAARVAEGLGRVADAG